MSILPSTGWKIKTLLLPQNRVRYLPWNDATANVVHRDFALYFQGLEFWNVNISKTVRAGEKYLSMTFIEVAICHRMGPWQMAYFVTLTLIFKVKIFLDIYLLQKLRSRFTLTRSTPTVELFSFSLVNVVYCNGRRPHCSSWQPHRIIPFWQKQWRVILLIIDTITIPALGR